MIPCGSLAKPTRACPMFGLLILCWGSWKDEIKMQLHVHVHVWWWPLYRPFYTSSIIIIIIIIKLKLL